MDQLRRFITEEMEKRNLTAQAASEAAGLGSTYIWEMLNKPGWRLGAKGARQLSEWLNVSPALLFSLEGRNNEPEFSIEEIVAMIIRDEHFMDIAKSWPDLDEPERDYLSLTLEAIRLRRQRRDQPKTDQFLPVQAPVL